MPPPYRPGPLARRLTAPLGGQPTQLLPEAAAVGINNLTATGANLIGSVNPQGLAATWWFVYGTTPQFGSTTTVQNLSATSIPQTFTVQLSGLTTGIVYWFAIVASTSGGTVTSAPLSFTPAAQPVVTNASNPTTPTATPQVAVPHYLFPITFNAKTGVGVVEQDTLAEVFSNVQTIMACPVGACPELPTFGYHEPTFGQVPLNTSQLVADVQRWEPRATEAALSEAPLAGDPDTGTWLIGLTTQYAGGEH